MFSDFLTKRLGVPVAKASPAPFEWTEPEIAKPQNAEHHLKRTNARNKIPELVALEFPEITKSVAIKNQSADQALQKIIGKSHLTHLRKGPQ